MKKTLRWTTLAALCALLAAGGCRCNFGVKSGAPRSMDKYGNVVRGRPAPDFTLVDLQSNAFRLSLGTPGKITIVTFFASWCEVCKAEIPVLNRLQQRLGGKGLQVIGVNSGDDPVTANSYAVEHNIRYPVLLDSTGEVLNNTYGVNSLPLNIVVGRDGKVVYVHIPLPEEPDKYFENLIRK